MDGTAQNFGPICIIKPKMNKSAIRLGNNEVLKTLTKTLKFVDADANSSTIALCKCYSGKLESIYCKCPKISNTKASDKMTYANSVDPDQTAPEGAV